MERLTGSVHKAVKIIICRSILIFGSHIILFFRSGVIGHAFFGVFICNGICGQILEWCTFFWDSSSLSHKQEEL